MPPGDPRRARAGWRRRARARTSVRSLRGTTHGRAGRRVGQGRRGDAGSRCSWSGAGEGDAFDVQTHVVERTVGFNVLDLATGAPANGYAPAEEVVSCRVFTAPEVDAAREARGHAGVRDVRGHERGSCRWTRRTRTTCSWCSRRIASDVAAAGGRLGLLLLYVTFTSSKESFRINHDRKRSRTRRDRSARARPAQPPPSAAPPPRARPAARADRRRSPCPAPPPRTLNPRSRRRDVPRDPEPLRRAARTRPRTPRDGPGADASTVRTPTDPRPRRRPACRPSRVPRV